VFSIAFAQEAAQGVADATSETGQPGNPFTGMLPMIVIFFAIMYFLMIRPNQKREKERREMLNALAKNDKVITTGGICGTVVGLSDKTVVLRVDDEDNVKMEFVRGAVAQVVSTEDQKDKK
jgi:preprotein translocase subunit YajC